MKRFLLCLLGAGCVSHTNGETEVGVVVCKISWGCSKAGVQDDLLMPGTTTFLAPFIREVYTFDTKVQNLEMVAATGRGDRSKRDDLQFKTIDGNDISMDVTVAWTIDQKKVPQLLQNVGTSTNEVKETLVRPMARTLVRDVLNELDSESVYNSDKRFEKAEKARQELAAALEPFGIMINQVILHEHRFNPDYEKVIHDRKLAEQHAQQLKSETEAAAQESIRNLESARGKVASQIAQADGTYYQEQQNAEAIVAERTANAQAIAKRNEALRGSGGRAMVKLRIAEALTGKPIVLVPSSANGIGLNKLDVNKLVESAQMADEVQEKAEEKAEK